MSDIKVASYNLYNGSQEQTILENISIMSEKGVNVFCLQEVRRPHSGEFIGDKILQKLGDQWQGEFFLSLEPGSFDYGLGVVWKNADMDLVKFETLSFPVLDKLDAHEQLIEYFLSGPRKPVQRGCLIGTFKVGGKNLRLINLHIDWHGGYKHRFRQIEHLINYLMPAPDIDGELICGDFNTIGFLNNSRQMEMIKSVLGSEYITCFPGFCITTTHYQHLDHIFVKKLAKKNAEVMKLPGSDHYPVVAEISL